MNEFKVGDRVKPLHRESYGGSRRGVVVEIDGERCRVLWEPWYPGCTRKRTWRRAAYLLYDKAPPAPGNGTAVRDG